VSGFKLILLTGGVVTAILSIYAVVLAFRLKDRAKRRSQPMQSKSQSQLDAQQSIRVIAQALLQKDLSSTEAAMRIGFLAQQFQPTDQQAQSIQAFQKLAMATSHLPILNDWKALSSAEKSRLEKQRQTIEESHAQAIQVAATALAKSA
jgi:hypothetical protein